VGVFEQHAFSRQAIDMRGDRRDFATICFFEILKGEGREAVNLPPRLPNLTPHIERFMRSIKDESLARWILFGERPL